MNCVECSKQDAEIHILKGQYTGSREMSKGYTGLSFCDHVCMRRWCNRNYETLDSIITREPSVLGDGESVFDAGVVYAYLRNGKVTKWVVEPNDDIELQRGPGYEDADDDCWNGAAGDAIRKELAENPLFVREGNAVIGCEWRESYWM